MTPSHSVFEGIRFLEKRNKWQARIKLAGQSLSKTFSSLEGATAWRAEQLSKRTVCDVEATIRNDELVQRFIELFDEWLADPIAFNSPETREKAIKITRFHLKPVFGERPVTAVSPEEILEFLRGLLTTPVSGPAKKQRSPKTVKNVLGVLSGFFEWCAVRSIISENPAADQKMREKFRRLVKTTRPREYLANSIRKKARTPDEMRKLIAVTSRCCPEDAFAIEFFLHTGVRLGEAAALQWSDIVYTDTFGRALERPMVQINKTMSFQTQQIKLGAKCNSNGQVELNSRMIALLKDWRVYCEGAGYGLAPADSLLPQVARSPSAFSQRITRYGERAGIRHVSPHSFRHTSITFQVVQGASLEQVQKVARHSTYNMTAAYYDASQMQPTGITELVAVALSGGLDTNPPRPSQAALASPIRLLR